jgi:hypothetical protein
MIDGDIDQVRIFSKALSSDEVDTLYAETACVYECTTDDVNYPSGTTPVAYYKLDNSSEDYSTGGNDGSDTNVEYRFGRYGQAAVFNGSSSKIDYSSSIIPSSGGFSISWWMKWNGDSNYAFLFDTAGGGATNGFYCIVHDTSDEIYWNFKNGSYGTNISVSYPVSERSEWTHFVITWDGTTSSNTAKIYKNNVATSGTQTVTQAASGQNFKIGYTGAEYFNGSIDQVRIYSTALTSSQVTELYEEKPCADTSNFKTVLYEGNSSTQYISNVGFSPDLVWIKRRTTTATDHVLMDTIREKYLISNKTNAEASYGSVFDFNHLGFDLNGNSSSFNLSGDDYVAWCWKGGGDDVLNEVGDIDSQVSANTESGFSIVKFTSSATISDTIGHGLFPSAPEMIIYKRTNTTSNWTVYTNIIDGSWDYLRLNKTDAKADSASTWSTSSTIKNVSTAGDWIAYCFHSVAGYSKIGSYTGNGSSTGPIVYTTDDGTSGGSNGFEPRWVMIKRTDDTGNWYIVDSIRSTANPRNDRLLANTSNYEVSYTPGNIDFLSNGFQLKGTYNSTNALDGTYIYMAFK